MVSRLIQLRVIVTTFLLSGTYLSSAQQQKPVAGCRPIADVIFLLDGSDSISEQEFSQQLDFIKRFVQLSDISPESVRVGLTVVSSTIGDEFPLSLNSTKENLLQVLNTINQPQEGSRTDLGLVEMEQLFNRHARRGVLRIGVILTDGRAKYVRATEGEARVIKDAGVFLIAVGVGRLIKFAELEKIASTTNNAYNLEPIDRSTKYLAETVALLGQDACTGHNLVNQFNLNPPTQLSGGNIVSNQEQANIASTLMTSSQDRVLTNKAPTLTASSQDQTLSNVASTLMTSSQDQALTNKAPTLTASSQDQTLSNVASTFTSVQELQAANQPLLNLNPFNGNQPWRINKAVPKTDSIQLYLENSGGILPSSVQSAVQIAISPMLNSNAANSSPISASTAVDPSIDPSLIGLEYISGNLPGPVKPNKPMVDRFSSSFNSVKQSMPDQLGMAVETVNQNVPGQLGMAVETVNQNVPGQLGMAVETVNQIVPGQVGVAVEIPAADQLMLNLDSINGNIQSVQADSAMPMADLSQINLQFSNRNMPSDRTNQMDNLLKQNSLSSISRNFDVKMEPFIAVDTIKSRVPSQQSPIPDSNTNLDMFGSQGTVQEQVPYNIQIGNDQRPLTRFAAPQLVYTPVPDVMVATTTPATQHIPVPKVPATTKSPRPQPNVEKYLEKSPTPGETANMIIQSLIANKDLSNGILSDMNKVNGVTPSGVLPTRSMGAKIIPTKGVGVNFPGRTVSETLAFLKQEIKPARTVEEHLNPIFQMFDATGPAQNIWRTKAATVQPTTTTMSPRDSYRRAEMAALRDHCSKGRFVDGISYISKPGTCSEFLQCYKESNELKARVATCPFETFFDDVHSVCRHYTEHNCWTDPCVDNTIASYAHLGNCRAHWNCQGGQSRPVCCPSGTSYVPGFGCARNVTCTDTCMDFGNLNEVTHASKCKLLSVDADPHFYFEHVAGMGWMVRMCAQGSRFDQILCKCHGANEVVKDVCKPELYMDFQGGLVDVSGNNLAMGIYNVELDGGTGAFFGKSHLKLWRFSGMSLGQHVTISFRFRTSVTAKKGKLMHIVSNCCYSCAGEPQPSLDVAIIPADQGGVAVFSTTTREAGEIFLFVPYKDTFTGWNTLEYRYDGLNMRGTVNEQSAQKSIVGNIIGRSEPLLIGSCGQTNAYDGFLDEFKFYMCNP